MRRFLFVSILFLFQQAGFGQIRYDKGFIIDNTDQKVNCYIKNKGWVDNPTSFEYRLDSLSSSLTATIETVKEFGIGQETHYVRNVVNIDKGPTELAELTHKSQPVWVKDTLFLKTLVEGKASLYAYYQQSMIRYFYATDSVPVQQLVYRKYFVNPSQLAENMFFRNQLRDLKCGDKRSSTVKYNKKDLMRFFVQYNICKGEKPKVFDTKANERLRLKLMAGFNHSSFHVIRPPRNYEKSTVDYKPSNSFTAGLELEMLLSLNKQKWSVFAGTSYHTYHGELMDVASFEVWDRPKAFEYKAVEARFGPRHYSYLTKKSKLFFQLEGIFYQPLDVYVTKSKILANGITGAIGLGYAYGRFSVETNLYWTRNLMHDYSLWTTRFQNASLLVGITLF